MKQKDLKPGDKVGYREGWNGAPTYKAEYLGVRPGVEKKYSRGRTADTARIRYWHLGKVPTETVVPFAHVRDITWEQIEAADAAKRANQRADQERKQLNSERWLAASQRVEALGLQAPSHWKSQYNAKEGDYTPLSLIEALLDTIQCLNNEITELGEVDGA